MKKNDENIIREIWIKMNKTANSLVKDQGISEIEAWKKIRRKVNSLENKPNTRERMIRMIDKKIDDITYFEEVNKVTRGFSFLQLPIYVATAVEGASRTAKFSTVNNHDRFESLASRLREANMDEESAIEELLKDKTLSAEDRRILESRRLRIIRDREAKCIYKGEEK